MGTLNLVFPEAQEESVAQTRAFSTLYLATAALAALWAGREDLLDQMDKLPEAGRRCWIPTAICPPNWGAMTSIDGFTSSAPGRVMGWPAN